MISILSGVVIFSAAGVGLWYFMPKNGVVHPHAKVPFLDSIVPITIVALFTIGVALIVAGVMT